MDVYYIEFAGKYLVGHSIVLAKDEDEARANVTQYMKKHGIKKIHIYDVKLVDKNKEGVQIFYDGDY